MTAQLTTTEALLLLLDQVDYTNGACSLTELVGAALDESVIKLCRDAVARERTAAAESNRGDARVESRETEGH